MELNKVIKLKDGEKINISNVKPQQRIVYIKDSDSVVVVYSQRVAPQIRMLYGDSAIMMPPSQALAMYPEKFFADSSMKESRAIFNKNIFLYVNEEQERFIKSKGNVSQYIRSLIDRAMEIDGDTDGD